MNKITKDYLETYDSFDGPINFIEKHGHKYSIKEVEAFANSEEDELGNEMSFPVEIRSNILEYAQKRKNTLIKLWIEK